MPKQLLNKNNLGINQSDVIPKLKIHLFGDWAETIKILNRLSPEIKACSIKAQLKLGNKIKDKVKGHLQNQDLGWPSLSERYGRRKRKAGLDSRILIAWAEYYHAINVWQISNQHLVMIGVKSGIYTRDVNGKRSKLQVAQIALIHEFSSGKRVPRRPLWNPTIAEMGGIKGMKAIFTMHFYATLRTHGIPFKLLKVF